VLDDPTEGPVIDHRQTTAAEVRMCADHIMEVRWHDGVSIALSEIEDVLAAQSELMRRPTAVLVDSRRVRSMTREAQERTANHPNNAQTVAVAILVGNPVSQVIGNFFMVLSSPSYPTRLFRDERKARRWLAGHF
jgi:hypothetical protein